MSAPTPPPIEQWPPEWARTVAFFVGLGLMGYETVLDKAAHLVVYGPAFLLTGLPIARGVEVLLDRLPWGPRAAPPPPPQHPPSTPSKETE